MTSQSVLKDLPASFWITGVIISCGVPFVLAEMLIFSPCWWAVCSGAGLVLINSILARMINERAVGVSQRAFWGWGIIANTIRMLTLIVIFAYMVAFFKEERGNFLISGLSAFFVMMPVEVIQLLKSQNKAIAKLEYGRDAN